MHMLSNVKSNYIQHYHISDYTCLEIRLISNVINTLGQMSRGELPLYTQISQGNVSGNHCISNDFMASSAGAVDISTEAG